MTNFRSTQKLIARHGCVLRPRVPRDVFAAVYAQGQRAQMSPDAVAAQIITWWYEDLLEADRLAREKEKAAGAASKG